MPKKRKKVTPEARAAGQALAAFSVAKRLKTTTAKQRSKQGRAAVRVRWANREARS